MTDRYSYDAFGNSISQSGGTPNIYRYQGEAFDAITGLVYLRSRHLSNSNGRFLAADTYAFSLFDPINIHRYIYAQDNPINRVDPSGNFSFLLSFPSLLASVNLGQILSFYAPTVVRGGVLLGGIDLFMKPGFEYRQRALDMLRASAITGVGFKEALGHYELSGRMIRAGSQASVGAIEIVDILELGRSFLNIAKSMRLAVGTTLDITVISRIEEYEIIANQLDGKNSEFFMLSLRRSSVSYSSIIEKSIELDIDLLDFTDATIELWQFLQGLGYEF